MKTTSKLGMISLLGLLQLLLLTQLVTAGIVDHSDTYVASVHDHYSDDSSLNVLLQDGTVWELHQLPPSWTQHAVIFEPPFPVDDISWWGMESLITTDGQIWVLDGPDPYGEWVLIHDFESVLEIDRPEECNLGNSYPNPFNPTTTIPFTITQPGHVTLEVFNLLGEKVATLVDGMLSAGEYDIRFNGTDLPSGLFSYTLRTETSVKSGKFTLLKQLEGVIDDFQNLI